MADTVYEVVEKFDPTRDYGIHIRGAFSKCLASFEKGERLVPKKVIEKNLNRFGRGNATLASNKVLIHMCFSVGRKIGMLRLIEPDKMALEEFYRLETVSYFKDQLRSHRYKNIMPKGGENGISATQKAYLYSLYKFNNWITGKEFEFSRMVQMGPDMYRKEKQSIQIGNVEHFLRLYQESSNSQPEYVRVIKSYLLSPVHQHKKPRSVSLEYYSILSYFEKNDSPIHFKFDPKTKYETRSEEENQRSLSLEDLMKMLTVGRPSITQKAVILCKFQRGLDTITFCDRFNFQAWEQMVRHFGTDKHTKWDLEKCPVPIRLTRIKTDFTHLGFLDRDAVAAIQDYLEYRYKRTGNAMQEGEPLFLNSKREAIREPWIRQSFFRIANTAGIQRRLDNYTVARYEKESHELRDLLKSTLLACGTRYDVADHVIGHKPKDSYEKQAVLYPENMRAEYAKASRKINIFSNISQFLRGDSVNEALQRQIEDLRLTVDIQKNELEKEQQTRNGMFRWFERYRQTHPEEFEGIIVPKHPS